MIDINIIPKKSTGRYNLSNFYADCSINFDSCNILLSSNCYFISSFLVTALLFLFLISKTCNDYNLSLYRSDIFEMFVHNSQTIYHATLQ